MCAVKIGRLGKFDLNPRGELWRKDESRFGHKFLSKFGWSQGKGLGKNEDGIAESLKVKVKIGNAGVGWSEKLPIGIDYREYDAVLEDLNKKYGKSAEMRSEDVSLEKRSQQFKNRIHYQKFVRGKDISRYSEKDMSCIFLAREPEKEMETSSKESTLTNTESSSEKPVPTFNSQLSIADYFALKMKTKIGSSLNAPKESKNCEETSQLGTAVESRKRKHELKHSKKAKQFKLEPECDAVEESLSYEEESSNSSREASEGQFQNSEQLYINEHVKKKNKFTKKMAKLFDTLKSKQGIANLAQERSDAVGESSAENESSASSENCSDLHEESKNRRENEIMTKKRKSEQDFFKKAKKICLEEANISPSIEKNSSHSESDNEDGNSSEKCVATSLKTEKRSRKESKKHKSKIPCLKSCLRSNKYCFKEKRNVSFCENISYKIIENALDNVDSDIVLETSEQLSSCCDEDKMDREVVLEAENIKMNLADDQSDGNTLDSSDVSCHEDVITDNTVPECFKLPKRSSANYDSWLETQRIAARMKVYKNMAKKMKKHPVLRKTNLLEIKGYGNWGF